VRLPISRLSVQLGAVLLIAAVAACGSSSVTSVPQPSASSSGASTQSVTTSTTSTTSVPPLTVGGITASAVLPIASAAVPLSELVSTSPPGSTPALSAGRLAQSATRSPLDSAPTVLLYIELTSTASVTLNGTPSFSFTVPSVVAGASYYLGFYGTNNGTTGWQAPGDGPATVSGTTLTFAASSTGSVTITPTTPAIVALYYTTPTASPSASPSPAGSAAPALSPTSLTFDADLYRYRVGRHGGLHRRHRLRGGLTEPGAFSEPEPLVGTVAHAKSVHRRFGRHERDPGKWCRDLLGHLRQRSW